MKLGDKDAVSIGRLRIWPSLFSSCLQTSFTKIASLDICSFGFLISFQNDDAPAFIFLRFFFLLNKRDGIT